MMDTSMRLMSRFIAAQPDATKVALPYLDLKDVPQHDYARNITQRLSESANNTPKPIPLNLKDWYNSVYADYGGVDGLKKIKEQNGIKMEIPSKWWATRLKEDHNYNGPIGRYSEWNGNGFTEYGDTLDYTPLSPENLNRSTTVEWRPMDLSTMGTYSAAQNKIKLNKDSLPALDPKIMKSTLDHEISHTLWDPIISGISYEARPTEQVAHLSSWLHDYLRQGGGLVNTKDDVDKFINFVKSKPDYKSGAVNFQNMNIPLQQLYYLIPRIVEAKPEVPPLPPPQHRSMT